MYQGPSNIYLAFPAMDGGGGGGGAPSPPGAAQPQIGNADQRTGVVEAHFSIKTTWK